MDISPEERLLAVIKEQEEAPVTESPSDNKPETPQAKMGKQKKLTHLSEALKKRFLKNNLPDSNILKSVNKYLTALLGILVAYLIYDISVARPYKNAGTLIGKDKRAEENVVDGVKKEVFPNIKDYSYYLNEISGKQIFGRGENAGESSSGVTAVSDEAADNFVLAGIVAGKNPQAIIQNKRNEKVYYLNKGDSLDGYIVEEISKNKVVLDHEGKKTTLFF